MNLFKKLMKKNNKINILNLNERMLKNKLFALYDEKQEIFIDRKETLLAKLCDKYGSDKGSERIGRNVYPWPAHTYTNYYARLFNSSRFYIQRVFECGIGTRQPNIPANMGVNGMPGASLRVWQEYFPAADIYGADIDSSVLFQEGRIRTFYVDQTSPASIEAMWNNIDKCDFDIIIDDGLHEFEAGICLFENSISKLRETGLYVIEDVIQSDLIKYVNYFKSKSYYAECVLLNRKNAPLNDNNLIIIRKNM